MGPGGFVIKEGVIRVSDRVRLREEYFGGIVFHTGSGNILEVDHEAYMLIAWLRETGAADIRALSRRRRTRDILPVLIRTGIVEYSAEKPLAAFERPFASDQKERGEPRPPNENQILSAPETVHLAVTWQCDGTCLDCYALERRSVSSPELGTAEMRKMIGIFADNGVFQLAVGGGEPFARPDIADIAGYADGRGLAVHITTGRYTLEARQADALKHIKSLHIGIRSEELLAEAGCIPASLNELVAYVRASGVGVGVNIILTRFTVSHIEKLTELLLECGVQRFIFLRYKPIADRVRWENANPCGEELNAFRQWLTRFKQRYPHIALRVDCAAAFLMRDISPRLAIRSGIRGCAAGERIISVAPDGSVYPCSQLVGPAYAAGNLTRDSFGEVWRESAVLNKYRQFRKAESFTDSACGRCGANRYCGGCRVFTGGSAAGEAVCPADA